MGPLGYVRIVNATSPEAAAPGRIVLLTTSHRVAPGLLSWPAWQALRSADRVLCADGAHPQLPYLREAGIPVDEAAPTAQELIDACAGGRTVVVVATGEGEPALTDGLARLAGTGRVAMPELELLPASYDLPGARLLDLVQVMDRIRVECPWSSQQTHKGLAKYGIEEAYELVEAIEDGDRDELREELGDVLLQVVFHSRIAEEDPEAPFSIDDVAGGIVTKLIHRHPHVFGDETATTPEEVKEHWLRTKAEEKRRESVTEGIPSASRASPSQRSWRPESARSAWTYRCRPVTASATNCSRWRSARRRREWTRKRPCGSRPARTGTRYGRRRGALVAPPVT